MSPADLAVLLKSSPKAPPGADLPDDYPSSGRPGLRLQALLARQRCREEIHDLCRRRGVPVHRYLSPN